jgi:alanine racemase
MNRYGIDSVVDGVDIINFCHDYEINVVGLLTHFSLEDEAIELYDLHVKKFKYYYDELSKLNKFSIVHAENSYTMQKLDDNLMFCNYVRCGIICYGYGLVNEELKVMPSYFFSGKVLKIRSLKAGDSFSYGLVNKLFEDGLVAIVDVGYGDGILRSRCDLKVLINGVSYPIIGNISMSNCYVLVDVGVKVFDEVVFYNDEITVEQQAKKFDVPTSLVMSYLK